MDIEKLELEHQDLISSNFSKLGMPISEYSFANVYLFREIHQYEVVCTDRIYIRGKTRDGVFFYMPTEPIDLKDLSNLQKEISHPITLFPIPDSWLRFFPKDFTHTSLPSDSDYLYSLEQMRTYPGNSLSGQRNHVHQFETSYQAIASPLDEGNKDKAIAMLDRWHKNDKEADYISCFEALTLLSQLGLEGTLYEVDGVQIGFIIGEYLNSEVYVIHFAKADTNYKGVYPFMYQQYALNLSNACKWINQEQDLGIPGLRKAKLSYQPAKLETKWRVTSNQHFKA